MEIGVGDKWHYHCNFNNDLEKGFFFRWRLLLLQLTTHKHQVSKPTLRPQRDDTSFSRRRRISPVLSTTLMGKPRHRCGTVGKMIAFFVCLLNKHLIDLQCYGIRVCR